MLNEITLFDDRQAWNRFLQFLTFEKFDSDWSAYNFIAILG